MKLEWHVADEELNSPAQSFWCAITSGENMIGRDERCDIVLSQTMGDISRLHAVIDQATSGAIKLTSLSASGTRVPSKNIA